MWNLIKRDTSYRKVTISRGHFPRVKSSNNYLKVARMSTQGENTRRNMYTQKCDLQNCCDVRECVVIDEIKMQLKTELI